MSSALTTEHLRLDLLGAQSKLLSAGTRPMIIVLGGSAGAGRGEVAGHLAEWMDPRHLRASAFDPKTLDTRPVTHAFFQALPPKGKAAVFFWGWYGEAYYGRAQGKIDHATFEKKLKRALELERLLVDDGAILVKVWLDLDKKQQRARFDAFEKNKATSWRSNHDDWEEHRNFKKYAKARDAMLAHTSPAFAPWHFIPAADIKERDIAFGRAICQAVDDAFAEKARAKSAKASKAEKPEKPAIVYRGKATLANLDRSESLSKEKAAKIIPVLQGRLNKLIRDKAFQKRSLVVAFEGSDAAGKGGAIRRVAGAFDARFYRVIPIAAPTEEERAYPYLWRFWRNVPPRGRATIFDRSWYGRVLVERVEGFATPAEWSRAYREINDFEEELRDNGAIVVKFWLAVTKDEQLRRFKEREQTPFKQFKITDEDFRNRKKWDAYEEAAKDMVAFTSTKAAPWTLVGANDKHHARVAVLKELVQRIERAL